MKKQKEEYEKRIVDACSMTDEEFYDKWGRGGLSRYLWLFKEHGVDENGKPQIEWKDTPEGEDDISNFGEGDWWEYMEGIEDDN